ncbi:MAG TPA: DNA polymerase [Sphaerochaeta sp.]|nr:DNA polymerase [Sphaerochaeta sp.]
MHERKASIVHINITDFAAAVAIAKQPRLAGRPFAIALEGSARRVIITTSRTAWQEGIRVGMPVSTAQRMLPDLEVLPPDTQSAAKADSAIASLVASYSPDIQCDKGGHVYLDMKGTDRLFGPVLDSALQIRKDIREQLGLEGAVAVASNKLVAKIGTRAIRPCGLAHIREGEEASFLAAQDVSLLSGVGPAIARLLSVAGITQIGQIAALDDNQVIAFLGRRGLALRDAARGLDTSPLQKGALNKRYIQRKVNFAEPILNLTELKAGVFAAGEDAGLQMRLEGMSCQAVQICLFWSDGRTSEATKRTKGQWVYDFEIEDALFQAAQQAMGRRVRILAFTLKLFDLGPALKQTDLFIPEILHKQDSLQQAIDEVRRRFGPGILTHATALCHGN